MWRLVRCNNSPFLPRQHNALSNLLLKSKSRFASSEVDLPDSAKAVVIGGGVIGSSVAYHLAKLHGWDKNQVILLERDKITSGTTWHAAGLMVTFGSTSETSTEMRKYSRDLYAQLEEETGQSSGFQPIGFIELASNKDRLEEYRRISAFNRKCGVNVQEISAKEVKELFPLCRTDDILAGFYVKEDGRVNPVDATMGLIKGARKYGAKIVENTKVQEILTEKDQVVGVKTESGKIIKTPVVVNCAGMWARQLAEKNKIIVPNQAAEHYYLITDTMEEVSSSWPVIEDPESYTYIRPEGDGLMIGLFETKAAAWNVNKIPNSFSFGEISPDWDRMTPFVEKAMNRVPKTLEIGTKNFFCGPESFTPDVNPIVGESPEYRGYFVGAGLNSIGILTGGGIGRLLAHWIATGKPDQDVTQINIDRFHKHQCNPQYRAHRVVESLGKVYTCHYPSEASKTARNVKRSAIYDRLVQQGAYFKEVSSWEGANWYDPSTIHPKIEKMTWGKENWFPFWKNEHQACRENVALFDMSFMSKFLVQGRDAGDFLNYLSTANVNEKVNQITYTQWLNDDGKMEADLTVCKIENEKFLVIATDTMHRHVETWMKRHVFEKHVFITDVTGSYTQINIQGPNSRKLLQTLTSEDLSNENFPFRCAKEIDLGYARLLCVRITYVGELGYELVAFFFSLFSPFHLLMFYLLQIIYSY